MAEVQQRLVILPMTSLLERILWESRFEQLVWMRMGELCDTAVDLFDGMGDG